jgi:hypothetical protein
MAIETKRTIEAEGGVCEAFVGDMSRADDVATMVDGWIQHLAGPGGEGS